MFFCLLTLIKAKTSTWCLLTIWRSVILNVYSRKKDKEDDKMGKGKEKWEIALSIISIALSAIAIMVSLFTHIDSKKLQERIRYKEELSQKIEDNRALIFNNNTEFWDYSIDSILKDMISKNGLTDELEEISLYLASKQSGSALTYLLENEEVLSKNDNYYLLKACIEVRDYIISNEYLIGRFHANPIPKSDITENISINVDKYIIVLGILDYYSDDIAGAARHLKHAQSVYAKDSPFYDISNYWLALISIRLRNNICDIEAFLDSTYNNSKQLDVMKSSIAFLFNLYLDKFPGTSNYIFYTDKQNSYYGSYYVPKPVINASQYLSDTDEERITSLGLWYNQKDLFSFYNLIYGYSHYLHLKGSFISAPRNTFENQNPVLTELLDSTPCDEVFFIDPRVRDEEFDAKFEQWFRLYSYSLRIYGIDNIVPVDVFFDRMAMLSAVHSTEQKDYISYVFGYAYEYWVKSYLNQDDLEWEKALCATMALKYSSYIASGEEFDKAEAALIAYDYGYRYEYIMDALTEYYEEIGDNSNLERIKEEKSIYRM